MAKRHISRKIGLFALIWLAQGAIAAAVSLFWISQGMGVEPDSPLGLVPLSEFGSALGDPEFWLVFTFYYAILSTLQGIFLFPVRRPTAAKKRGASVRVSLAIAGLLMAVLTLALVFAIWSLTWLISQNRGHWGFSNTLMYSIVGVSWVIYTPLLMRFCRTGPRETLLSRIASRLFLGTMVEAAAIIPIDVMIRRKTDCYCAQGTYLGLSICGTVGLFVAGPAVFLPILMKRRRRWYEGRCDMCAYDMSGCLDAQRCPECGSGWRTGKSVNVP
jgi:hypothetical protein